MPSHGGATAVSVHESKKSKSREVSSRFLSSTSGATCKPTEYGGIPSPNNTPPPLRQKPKSSTDSRKHRSLESSGFLRGLWPSSSTPNSKNPDTLADHLGNDRIRDLREEKNKGKNYQDSIFLNRQRSCTELSRFGNEKKIVEKENHKPIFGGSMRYTGKLKFPRKSNKSSNSIDDQKESDDHILPGRFSVDETALRKNSFAKGISDSDTQDSGSEQSDMCSGTSLESPVTGKVFPASYMAPTASSRKHGIEVPSKFMQDHSSRSRRWSADSAFNKKPTFSPDTNSPKIFTLKNAMKKANSKWALSPGRSGSPIALTDNGFSNLKPPTSPSKGKGGVGSILSLGIEFLKGRKSYSSSLSPLGPGSVESVHQLKLLHNRLMQWRYTNARAETVNGNVVKQVESNLLSAWSCLMKLQHSVVQKKVQLQKEKLEMKLNYIIQSQINWLEAWGNMERQHISAVSNTKDCLHSVICRVPLVDGAKVEPQSASITVGQALDVASSINLMLITLSPMADATVGIVAELATVVTQEKLLLEECLELFRVISALEIQERSLKSSIMQVEGQQQLQQRHIST